MKVIIINDFANIEGGASNIAVNSALILARYHDVTFFAPVGPIDNRLIKSNVNLICWNDIDIANQKISKSIFTGLWNIKSFYKINKYIKSLGNEQIYIFIHSWTKNLSPSIFYSLNRENVKVFLYNHDYFSTCPNGGLFFFNTKTKCNLKPLSKKCVTSNCDSRSYFVKVWRVLRQVIFNHARNKLLRKNMNMIYVSDFSKNLIKRDINIKHKFHIIENPTFNNRNSKKISPEKNKKIGFLGRLSEEKGALFVAKNLSYIADQIIFIGDGKLKNEILKINKNFVVTGWLTHEEVKKELKKLRAIIFPSLLYETDGLSVKEAGLYGIPSIVSKDIAASRNIKDKFNGLTFDPMKIRELKDAIELINNDSKLKDLSDNCYLQFNSLKYKQETFYSSLLECIK